MRTSTGLPRRPKIRHPLHDYKSACSYFITICTYERRCTLSKIINDVVELSWLGQIVDEEWRNTPLMRPGVMIDSYVIMPNHMHFLVHSPDNNFLGSLIGGFKSRVTSRAKLASGDSKLVVWQDRFYDRIMVENRGELDRYRNYIADNPLNWPSDRYFCDQ
jgi:REP element-mobilizing transposase RayT